MATGVFRSDAPTVHQLPHGHELPAAGRRSPSSFLPTSCVVPMARASPVSTAPPVTRNPMPSTGVPGGHNWHLAPLSMAWQDQQRQGPLERGDLQSHHRPLEEPRSGRAGLLKHHEEEALVLWAWQPGQRLDGSERPVAAAVARGVRRRPPVAGLTPERLAPELRSWARRRARALAATYRASRRTTARRLTSTSRSIRRLRCSGSCGRT